MKKELLKIATIFFVTVFAVVWALNYIYLGPHKSKAVGETVSLSFSPSTVSGTTALTTTIKALPSAAITLRGYKFKINFNKSKVQITDINYKIGTVSLGLGDSNSTLPSVNSKGFIAVQGEIYGVGQPLTASLTDVVIITFTSTTASSTATITEGSFYVIGADFSINPASASAANSLSVNGGGPTATPTVTPGGPTLTPSPTVTPGGPTLTPIPTGSTNITLDLKLKFQGILKMPQTERNKLVVKVTVKNNDLKQSATGDFVTTDGVTWHDGAIPFTIPAAAGYAILIKGPYHLQKKICDTVPTETAGGTYRCDKGKITLTAGNNNLDFSGIVLLAGDLPDQDGSITAYDTSFIYNNLGKTDNDKCDVNRDGICDTQDFSLVIAALSIKNDEE